MDFSSISSENILGKLLRLPLKLIPPHTIMPILQGKLKGKKWIVGSGVHGYWLGSYEYEKRIIFERTVREGSIVYDIGANVGFYSLLASELVGKKGKVFAFEPNPRNLYYLKKHLELNKVSNVQILEYAVSDKNEIIMFDETESPSTGHISSKGNLIVNSVTLDSLTSDGKILLPDFIKVDIEGAESDFLRGAINILKNSRPVIFLAVHTKELYEECCKILKSLNYKLLPIDNKLNGKDWVDDLMVFPE